MTDKELRKLQVFRKECPIILKKSLKINEGLNGKVGMARDYNNIGNVYRIKRKHDQSLIYPNKALKIYKDSNDRVNMIGTS